jgi:hypothetical protein
MAVAKRDEVFPAYLDVFRELQWQKRCEVPVGDFNFFLPMNKVTDACEGCMAVLPVFHSQHAFKLRNRNRTPELRKYQTDPKAAFLQFLHQRPEIHMTAFLR